MSDRWRMTLVALLALCAWSGGVIFRQIQVAGLTTLRGFAIVMFAVMTARIAVIVVREMRYQDRLRDDLDGILENMYKNEE